MFPPKWQSYPEGPVQFPASSDVNSLLLSDSDSGEDGVRQVRVQDGGSQQQFTDVLIKGVPAKRVVDTGAKITIIRGELFSHVAAVARLKKYPRPMITGHSPSTEEWTWIFPSKESL